METVATVAGAADTSTGSVARHAIRGNRANTRLQKQQLASTTVVDDWRQCRCALRMLHKWRHVIGNREHTRDLNALVELDDTDTGDDESAKR